jgi:putative transposase
VVEGFGWVSIVLVLDWSTQKIAGHDASIPCTARPWLVALEMAVNHPFPDGIRGQDVGLMRDNGCQPTAVAFMQACHTLGSQQAFTSANHPKGHADTERMRRTRKEECLWLQEWTSRLALIRALEAWIVEDHEHDLHSALGYQSPRQFERNYFRSHGTPFVAA